MIETVQELAVNMAEFYSYKESSSDDDTAFFTEILKRGRIFVCTRVGKELHFCPSRFIGYKYNTRKKHELSLRKNGTQTTNRINKILKQTNKSNPELEAEFSKFCKQLAIEPIKIERKFWEIELREQAPDRIKITEGENGHAGEINQHMEGLTIQVLVNKYERNSKARKECLAHFGYKCSICDFDFEKMYGEIGKHFIHVHHIIPLSEHKKEYIINPKQDLRPVCPNCHAMLHTSNPPFSIDEMKLVIAKNQ